ncbi:MAG TPA: DUF4058 family protein [Gemmataceae bacterium]|nr:DUF4058 family protein [Gemmataceae bacterium]
MPLLDHFHPPLSDRRHWESFHAAWATEIMRTLNREVLPPGCFAEAQVHVGSRVEIDVATFEQEREAAAQAGNGNSGGVAVGTWAPPATALVMPAVFPDEIEVQVFRMSGGATLVAAIELVSPGNKDRPEARRAFAAKCASYLQQGIGLVVVDIVTERQANLHDELMGLMEQAERFAFAGGTPLYAVAYRPTRREAGDQVEIWPFPLALGQPLPTVPLALRGVATVPVDLETTYTATCGDSRL